MLKRLGIVVGAVFLLAGCATTDVELEDEVEDVVKDEVVIDDNVDIELDGLESYDFSFELDDDFDEDLFVIDNEINVELYEDIVAEDEYELIRLAGEIYIIAEDQKVRLIDALASDVITMNDMFEKIAYDSEEGYSILAEIDQSDGSMVYVYDDFYLTVFQAKDYRNGFDFAPKLDNVILHDGDE